MPHARRTSLALVDNAASLAFEYFADDGAPLPLAVLRDGPFRGTGATIFDEDLLRVRTVQAVLRLESASPRVRAVTTRTVVAVRNGTR